MDLSKAAINFTHIRYNPPVKLKLKFNEKEVSHLTTCTLVSHDGYVSVGVAACSILDTFDAEKGRKISFQRALEAANLTSRERGKYWQEYFKAFPRSSGFHVAQLRHVKDAQGSGSSTTTTPPHRWMLQYLQELLDPAFSR